MNFFGIFRHNKKKRQHNQQHPGTQSAPTTARYEDHLGRAAQAGHEARSAVKAKHFDNAWRLFHEQKQFYLKHATRSNFSSVDTVALDATVNEELANILRLENKHDQAFVHIVYWIIACSNRPIKRHKQKLQAYFNRCKFQKTPLESVRRFIEDSRGAPDFASVQRKVSEWRGLE